jgi:hypothetical protein
MRFQGPHQLDGPWYIIEHVISDRVDGSVVTLGQTDWADWCRSGDLLFAKDGKLFRLGYSSDGPLDQLERARPLIDLGDLAFKEVKPPRQAKEWDAELLDDSSNEISND